MPRTGIDRVTATGVSGVRAVGTRTLEPANTMARRHKPPRPNTRTAPIHSERTRRLGAHAEHDAALTARGLHDITHTAIDRVDITDAEYANLSQLRRDLRTNMHCRPVTVLQWAAVVIRTTYRSSALKYRNVVRYQTVTIAGSGADYTPMVNDRRMRRYERHQSARVSVADELRGVRDAVLSGRLSAADARRRVDELYASIPVWNVSAVHPSLAIAAEWTARHVRQSALSAGHGA